MRNKWTFVYYVLYTIGALCVGTWVLLLGTLCAGPTSPNVATNEIVEYNCHGTIVFIRPIQNFLLYWLIPILGAAILAGTYAKRKSLSG